MYTLRVFMCILATDTVVVSAMWCDPIHLIDSDAFAFVDMRQTSNR